ncbi:hypothetical protein AGLY_015289 [Aphis glycines]|uniref:Uncharacterized protein n=1 Tax=Aphis glycines TaxID=307491 RepID=A0A6G0T0S5_APHGL|nr:hypothetical protein AGLY_015289 [Aphis glycines]
MLDNSDKKMIMLVRYVGYVGNMAARRARRDVGCGEGAVTRWARRDAGCGGMWMRWDVDAVGCGMWMRWDVDAVGCGMWMRGQNPPKYTTYTTIYFKCVNNSNLYEICQNCENLQVILWLENLLKIWYKVLHKFFVKYLVDKIFLTISKYLKIFYKVPHMHNFLLLAFEVQILTKIRQNYEYLQIIFVVSSCGADKF